MKKILLLTLNIFLFTQLYSQNLHKVREVKESKIEKINLSISNQSAIPAASFSESFESTTFPPTGWSVVTNGGSGWSRETVGTELPRWGESVITTPPGGGNAVAYCTWSNDPSFNDQWLITPLIQNIQSQDTLYFWMRNQIFDYADSVYIYYSLDGTFFNPFGQVFYPEGSDTNWGKWFINLGQSITAGSDIYIGFREMLDDNQINGGAISLDLVSISGVNYPAQITVSKSFSFGDVTSSANYRMIGLPGNNNLPLSQFITGEQKKDWNVFYDNGADADFLVEFNGQATFNFTPGKGFWALSRNPITISERQVNSVSLTGNAFRISLNNGWNIISNPFEKNVSVADIRAANGLAQNSIFYNFNGSFPAAGTTTLFPYEGYYFFNDGTHNTLNIPYPFTIGKAQADDSQVSIAKQNLKISLKSKEGSKEIIVGIDPSSSNNFDEMDYLAPPNYFEDVSMNLVNKNLLIKHKNLFIEHRPEVGEGQIFNIEIKNKTGEKVTLSAEGINNFELYEIYLLDERLNKLYNLREQNQVNISPIHQNNNFSLLIGSKDFINNRKETIVPKEFALYQNYPNPFNPRTIIQYAIPENPGGVVTLKVYDILGNLVTTLVNEVKAPGNYEVEFNGNELSSGVYIYEIHAGNFNEVKKMSLLK